MGALIIGIVGGRFQDWYFRRCKKKLNYRPKHPRDLEGFPIERVRFAMVPYYLPVWMAACIGYGWMLQKRVHIAGPLSISFLIGAGSQFNVQINQLMLVDMFPNNAGASSATVGPPNRCYQTTVEFSDMALTFVHIGKPLPLLL
jgi:hypothetical protein